MRRRCPPPSRRGCRLAVAGKHGGALCRSVQVVFGWMSFFPGRSQPWDIKVAVFIGLSYRERG